MSDVLSPLGIEMASGGVAGFIAGYGVKKVVNIVKLLVAALVAIQVALIAALESQGLIDVDWSGVTAAISDITTAIVNSAFVESVTGAVMDMVGSLWAMLPVTGGFAGGIALGWRMG